MMTFSFVVNYIPHSKDAKVFSLFADKPAKKNVSTMLSINILKIECITKRDKRFDMFQFEFIFAC